MRIWGTSDRLYRRKDDRGDFHGLTIAFLIGTLWLVSVVGALVLGRDWESQLTLDAFERAEYATALLERCVTAGTEAMAYVGEVDEELHARLLLLPAPHVATLAEVDDR